MFTKNFTQLNKSNVDIAGGKGASLGEMINLGIPVPPGFVILSSAFDKFLMESNLSSRIERILDGVDYEDVSSVDVASGEIRDLIAETAMSDDLEQEIVSVFQKMKCRFVAVRSSATAEDSSTASWAGELESYLNTTEKTLLQNVKKCWSSLFTPRAIVYRKEKDLLSTKVGVAVVVQEMIESEVSGISFTVHPVTCDTNQMIIEAGFGLGEAVVSGSITPDSYIIDKKNWSTIDINIATQEKQIVRCLRSGVKWTDVLKSQQKTPKLSAEQIVELAKMCAQIENHYGFPCDIEWAMKGGDFFIVQSRPITTL